MFFNEAANRTWVEGEFFRYEILGNTLEQISKFGAKELYGGSIGIKLARDVQAAGGIMTFRDLNKYR